MPVAIDEVTAEVAESPSRGATPAPSAEAQDPAAAERRVREQLARLRQRAARLHAN